MIAAQTNAPYPNRLQLVLGDWIGPLIRPTSPPVEFDPTKDVEVYVDGVPLDITMASFDALNNRYLLFASKAFDLQGVIQVIHHMPSPPFQYGAPAVLPTFAVGIDPSYLPFTLYFSTDSEAEPGFQPYDSPYPVNDTPVLASSTNTIVFPGYNTLYITGYVSSPPVPPPTVPSPAAILSADVSACTPLVNLDIDSLPNLATLTLGSLPNLSTIYCGGNALASLDVAGLAALTYLDCDGNSLTTLDVGNNPALTYLDCDTNSLTALDVGSNPLLQTLLCYQNYGLASLDVSSNPDLVDLEPYSCALTSLDTSHNPLLYTLNCYQNYGLASLDLSANTGLAYLGCTSCPLGTLDLSANASLQTLSAEKCGFTALDISHNPALLTVDVSVNSLTQAAVDAILLALVTNGLHNGFADVSGLGNAAPSATGLGYVATLRGRGWTVNHN